MYYRTLPHDTVSRLRHVHHGPDTVPLLHDLERVVDLGKLLAVRDELVDLELAVEVVLDQVRQLGPTLDAAKRTTLPHPSRHKLERCGKGPSWSAP